MTYPTIIRKSKIKNNTYECIYSDGDRTVLLHNTHIVWNRTNGDIVLTTGGWQTKTTRERMNDEIGQFGHLVQRDYQWYYIPRNGTEADKVPYYDGMVINGQTARKVA